MHICARRKTGVIHAASHKHTQEEIRTYAREAVQVVLIANKIDMKSRRIISSRDLQVMSKELDLPLIETSARNADNVHLAFMQCARRYVV